MCCSARVGVHANLLPTSGWAQSQCKSFCKAGKHLWYLHLNWIKSCYGPSLTGVGIKFPNESEERERLKSSQAEPKGIGTPPEENHCLAGASQSLYFYSTSELSSYYSGRVERDHNRLSTIEFFIFNEDGLRCTCDDREEILSLRSEGCHRSFVAVGDSGGVSPSHGY